MPGSVEDRLVILETQLITLKSQHDILLQSSADTQDLVKRLGGDIREVKFIFNNAKAAVSFIGLVGKLVKWTASCMFALAFLWACLVALKTGHLPTVTTDTGSGL